MKSSKRMHLYGLIIQGSVEETAESVVPKKIVEVT
jgi:hypothetical protein